MTDLKKLGPDAEAMIAELLASGNYSDEADVLRHGVRLLRQQQAQLHALQAAVDVGRASPIAEPFTIDELVAEAQAELTTDDR